MCARAPSAAFKMEERSNDMEHEQFLEDTALTCPNRERKKYLSALPSIVQLTVSWGHLFSYRFSTGLGLKAGFHLIADDRGSQTIAKRAVSI